VPRRILLLITDLEIGGTPTVVRELAIRLNDPPHVVVEVACLKRWGPVADQLRDAGITVTAFGARRAGQIPTTLRRLVQLIAGGRFDVVFSFLVHANAFAAAASKRCDGVRFIQSIQTTQRRPAWHWWLQRVAARRAHAIVVPSRSVVLTAGSAAGIDEARMIVIPNAVEPRDFVASRRPTDPVPFPIGFLGRLDPVKRLPDLIEAVARLDGLVHLHVFGDGAQRRSIEAQVGALRLGNRVTLHGAVRRPQDALSQVGLLVLPSEAEGFGLVLIEAMAAGVPIVATEVDGIRDVVEDGKSGILVYPRNPHALARAIRALVEKPWLRQQLAERALARVHAEFTWDVVLPQYRRLLGIDAQS
jgi:glycosyltransferase involved in cell wall biosynthesis